MFVFYEGIILENGHVNWQFILKSKHNNRKGSVVHVGEVGAKEKGRKRGD